MTTELQELHEGDRVRIVGPDKQNPYRGEIGTVRIVGHLFADGLPVCIVEVPEHGELLYFQNEIERVVVENIRKGEIVKVISPGVFHGQECQVLHIERNAMHHRKQSDTWYLLDTRHPRYKWSQPYWAERHEIERVTPEESRGGM